MANADDTGSGRSWQPTQVYAMAVVCVVVGLAIGYLFRGSEPPSAPRTTKAATVGVDTPEQTSTLEQMKDMAEKKAEPLLERLKEDPNNAGLLVQIGDVYKQTHQFKAAADFYQRSLKSDPRNAGVRSDLASVLYYEGDADAALTQLQEALQYDAKNGAVLFNLGMIRWQAKKDGPGAIAAWNELLRTNPQLAADRKAAVEKLIAQAKSR